MSKKQSEGKKNSKKALKNAESLVSDTSEKSPLVKESTQRIVSDAQGTAPFNDAGTEYIEGFLREELGLDGDLTDGDFALAALDMLGDTPGGATVFFDPNELSNLAAKEGLPISEVDAFTKSIDELEEAIAAVSAPSFAEEGTVMMTLPDEVIAIAAEAAITEDIIREVALPTVEDLIAELAPIDLVAEPEAESIIDDIIDEIEASTEVESIDVVIEPEAAPLIDATSSEIATPIVEDIITEVVPADIVIEPEAAPLIDAISSEVATPIVEDIIAEVVPVDIVIEPEAAPLIDATSSEVATPIIEGIVAEVAPIDVVIESEAEPIVDATSSEVAPPIVKDIVAEAELAMDNTPNIKSSSYDEAIAELHEIQAIIKSNVASITVGLQKNAVSKQPPIVQISAKTAPIAEELLDLSDTPLPPEQLDETVENIDSMVVELEEPIVEEPTLRFDLDALSTSLNEDIISDDELADLAALVNGAGSDADIDALLAELGAESVSSTQSEQTTITTPQDEGSNYLDELVAALDNEVAATSLADSAEELHLISNPIDDTNTEQVIVFQIGDSTYGIPINNVLEIGEPPDETALPFVPHWVRGIINLRGEIISLIDLRSYFSDSANTLTRDWMIVAQTQDESITVGLIVDDVVGNRQFDRTTSTRPASDLDGQSVKYLKHIYRQEDGLVAVLDFDKLLTSADMRQFEPA